MPGSFLPSMEYQSKKDLIRHYNSLLEKISTCEEYINALRAFYVQPPSNEVYWCRYFQEDHYLKENYECLLRSEKQLDNLKALARAVDTQRLIQFSGPDHTARTLQDMQQATEESGEHCKPSRTNLSEKDQW